MAVTVTTYFSVHQLETRTTMHCCHKGVKDSVLPDLRGWYRMRSFLNQSSGSTRVRCDRRTPPSSSEGLGITATDKSSLPGPSQTLGHV